MQSYKPLQDAKLSNYPMSSSLRRAVTRNTLLGMHMLSLTCTGYYLTRELLHSYKHFRLVGLGFQPHSDLGAS